MPAQVTPEISVIIPTYNRKASLLRTLESLVQQTFPAERFEAVVVGSGPNGLVGAGYPNHHADTQCDRR